MSTFTTDFWRRQDEHIVRLIRSEPRQVRSSTQQDLIDSRRLQDAKSAYDRMLSQLNARDRALVEKVMTREMSMLLLAVTNAAGKLAVESISTTSVRRSSAPTLQVSPRSAKSLPGAGAGAR